MSSETGQQDRLLRKLTVGLVAFGLVAGVVVLSTGSAQTWTNATGERYRMIDEQAVELPANGELPELAELPEDLLASADDLDQLVADAGPFLELPEGPLGIPGGAMRAYQRAADRIEMTTPACKLDWSLLAAIGRIESNHANGGQLDADGNSLRPILGPQLNGDGVARIADTDGGELDGDRTWDRAVGPMQFIPSTWRNHAVDGNGDGAADPHNMYDATLAAGNFLCANGADLSDERQQARAVFRYNQSDDYVRTVLIWAAAYAERVQPLPDSATRPVEQQAAAQGSPDRPTSPRPQPPTSRPTPPPSTTSPPSSSQPPPSCIPSTPEDPPSSSTTPPSSSTPTSPPSSTTPPSSTPPSSTPPSSTPPSSTTPSTPQLPPC
ncbi:transglycosylase protein with SLT domain [Tamaricihabitans halophyticus]|uniref:Transglycosylase protein with SLT domain n=1 Tax=Tamaricihabitans halophyticus TaxID=1262583 RepID=A0A4R2R3Q2_9PSEU|nr:lytic murein transglycosylase [Tamaricihabitans halophyticus]TCP56349.1 transglycosylase protein with SLT domain [Tamaricihabitans halophyticus]